MASSTATVMKKDVRPFGWRDKVGYGFGDFGCNMTFALVSGYFMMYYVTVLGVDPGHYAIIILLTKIWDGINDPLIGALCDAKKPSKNGKFRPWIFWTSFVIAGSGAVMFCCPASAPYAVKIFMCIFTYVLWDACYTCINVPYGSMQSVITADPVQRAQLSQYRSIGAMLASLPMGIVLPLVMYDAKNDPIGPRFMWVALVMGLLSIVAFQITYRWCTERIEHVVDDKPKEKFNYFRTFRDFFHNRAMMGLTLATVAQILLITGAMQLNSYLFMIYFQDTKLLSVVSVASVVPMLLAIIFVKPAVKRFGKKALCSWPMLVSIAVYAFLLLKPSISPVLYITCMIVATLCMGFFGLLCWALVSDCIDYQEMQTGRREEGSIYATYSLFRKFAQGFGASLTALVLGATGYDATLPAAQQAASVGDNLKLAVVGLPLLGYIIAVIGLGIVYNLDNKTLAEIEKKLGRTGTEVNVGVEDALSAMKNDD